MKATAKTVRDLLAPNTYVNEFGEKYIFQDDAKELMSKVMKTFDNVFCGMEPNESGVMMFTIKGVKPRRTIFSIMVAESV